ncbi:MAG: HelD family protein [Christensenellales bacterium]|jgi:DNA helicase-2/ATP-dependent DNA helicase PcrA
MEYSEELRLEKEYTALVQQLLYAVVSRYKGYSEYHDESIRMLLSDAWEELRVKPTALSPQDLEQLSTEIDRFLVRKAFTQELAARYKKMLTNPYFARVDFRENGRRELEKIVIGLYSLKNTDGALLVHDWRAPICSLYYDSMPGEVSYDSPSGTISGYMTRKRQYRMEDGKLQYFVDTDVSIDDAMLLDILSRTTSAHMRNIVSTIQKEQNAAIRYEKSNVLSVVGSAGSGKTSVAMHRAAYLMYHQRDSIDANRIAVISPGAAFTEYISGVLAELGEENTQMVVLHSLYKEIIGRDIEHPLRQQEHLLVESNAFRRKCVREKSGAAFCEALEEFAVRFTENGPDFQDIALGKHVLISKEEMENMFRVQFRMLNPALRLVRIRAVIDARMENWSDILSKQYEDLLIKDYRGKELEIAKKLAVSQRLKPVRDQIKALLSLRPVDLYAMSVKNYSEDIALLAAQNAETNTILWEDAPAIVYLLLRLGFATANRQIMHLLIDEAQDYPEIALKALRLYYPKAHVTILGDPNQRTCPGMPPCDPTRWGACFGDDDAPLITLTKSYRSTLPITRLCNAILPELSAVFPVGREGEWPFLMPYSKKALTEVVDKFRESGCHRIAIVTRDQKTAQKIAQYYPQKTLLTGERNDMLPETDGIVIGSYSLMKGLEFDAVVVAWPDDTDLTDGERRRLYTACSRALHNLCVLSGGSLFDRLGIVM